jgi:hypothetical protein
VGQIGRRRNGGIAKSAAIEAINAASRMVSAGDSGVGGGACVPKASASIAQAGPRIPRESREGRSLESPL